MIKVSELTGAQLDYWVARAEGRELELFSDGKDGGESWFGIYHDSAPGGVYWIGGPYVHDEDFYYTREQRSYSPSTDWAHAGPLMNKINFVTRHGPNKWNAITVDNSIGRGTTPLQAICRAVVRAAFGDEVEEVGDA